MSTKHEFKEVTERRKVFVKRLCDICGKKSATEYAWEYSKHFEDDIKIERIVGRWYPEGDFRKKISLDMCPDCWCEKFVPWVEIQGGKFTVVDNEDDNPSDMRPDERLEE